MGTPKRLISGSSRPRSESLEFREQSIGDRPGGKDRSRENTFRKVLLRKCSSMMRRRGGTGKQREGFTEKVRKKQFGPAYADGKRHRQKQSPTQSQPGTGS